MAARIAPICTGDIMKLVDAFHVAEYVTKAANAIEGDKPAEASILSATWRETLKEKADGAESVLRSMRARRAGAHALGAKNSTRRRPISPPSTSPAE